MRRVRAAFAAVRRCVPASGRIGMDRCWSPAVLLVVFGGVLVLGRGLPSGDSVLGVLALGGWGLGLVPVHSSRPLTGSRRRTGEPAKAEPAAPLDR
jgi:hypothetical protein